MRREFRFAISAVAGASLAVFAAVPESFWTALPPLCLVRALSGAECPGCGMTRALSAVLHGHAAAGLSFNSGVAVVVPLLGIALLQSAGARR